MADVRSIFFKCALTARSNVRSLCAHCELTVRSNTHSPWYPPGLTGTFLSLTRTCSLEKETFGILVPELSPLIFWSQI